MKGNFIRYKIDEFRWAYKIGGLKQIKKAFFYNFNGKMRSKLNEGFINRGYNEAIKYGIRIPSDYPRESLIEAFYDQVYNIENFIPQENDSIVDVGAYTCDWSIYCSRVCKARIIYAFEPLRENIIQARSIIKINDITNVNLFEIALSDHHDTKLINHSQKMAGIDGIGTDSSTVEFRTLDSFDLECNILKIDVEGFEFDVLRGSLKTIRKNKPKIILETHSKILKEKCISLLANEGYELS
ncbi:MAG: FkbM family methyltransferase, partial [Thermoplasmataceae archaeon]